MSKSVSDAELIAALRACCTVGHDRLSIIGIARTLGCAVRVIRFRLHDEAFRAALSGADSRAAALLDACLRRAGRHGGVAGQGVRGYVAQTRDQMVRAVRTGTPLPEDWCGSGLPATEIAGPDCPPGSAARIALYSRRAGRGEELFSKCDWRGDRDRAAATKTLAEAAQLTGLAAAT